MPHLILIDDDPLVTASLKTILENHSFTVVAVGHDGRQAVNLYHQHQPDLLLMDIRMQKMSGLEATRQILQNYPKAKILLITTFQDDDAIRQAIQLGCRGYILKENIAGIIPAIQAVMSDQLVYDSKIVDKLATDTDKELPKNLSSREKDILILVASGLNNKEIAEKLFLSEGTIRNYISRLLDKLALRDRTQLAIYYYRH